MVREMQPKRMLLLISKVNLRSSTHCLALTSFRSTNVNVLCLTEDGHWLFIIYIFLLVIFNFQSILIRNYSQISMQKITIKCYKIFLILYY